MYASLYPPKRTLFETITLPITLTYAVIVSLTDKSLWYTLDILQNSRDPAELRKLDVYKDVDTTNALT